MSYCCWSDDSWRSDVRAYEGESGFVLHVARSRITGEIPEVQPIPFGGDAAVWEAYFTAHDRQMAAVGASERQPIGGPCDGEYWTLTTLEELRDKLRKLAAVGYRVPASAFKAIDMDLGCASGQG